MQIRPLTPDDLTLLRDIDATVTSPAYLHIEQSPTPSPDLDPDAALSPAWRVTHRPLREPRLDPNALSEDLLFSARQLAAGHDEGLALVAEYNDALLALVLAQPDPARGVLRLLDLRVDFDYRRQGIGTALAYTLLQHARDRDLRAVAAESPSDNLPAARFLSKAGFRLAGLDTLRHSNHDLVKERATLLWYAPLT